MGQKQERLPFFRAHRLRRVPRKSLPHEVMGIGEQALDMCRDLLTGAAAMLQENRELMRGNLRIQHALAQDADGRRKSPGKR